MKNPIEYHPDLAEMCTTCPKEECSGEPCKAYREKEAQLRAERRKARKPPAIMIEAEIDQRDEQRPVLRAYNAAIDGLHALIEAAADGKSVMWEKVADMEQMLRTERMRIFETLVDWAAIAAPKEKAYDQNGSKRARDPQH